MCLVMCRHRSSLTAAMRQAAGAGSGREAPRGDTGSGSGGAPVAEAAGPAAGQLGLDQLMLGYAKLGDGVLQGQRGPSGLPDG